MKECKLDMVEKGGGRGEKRRPSLCNPFADSTKLPESRGEGVLFFLRLWLVWGVVWRDPPNGEPRDSLKRSTAINVE